MRQHAFVLSASMLLLAALPAQRRGDGGGRSQEPPKLENFTFESGTLTSDKVKDGEAGYFVYLPKGHADEANKDKQYPWVLWLPGFGGPTDFQGRGGAEVLDKLRGENKIPELALVVFRAPGQGRRARTTYMNGEAAGDIEDLITGDLLTQLHTKYRLSDKREQRTVMGVSAGGFGAMKIAMRHPETFAAVAVHSAAILPADPTELDGMAAATVQRMLRGGIAEQLGDPIDKTKWAAQMPMGIVQNGKPESLKGLQIYFDAGTEDNYGFFEPNRKLHELMQERGFAHFFRPVEGGGHAWSSPTMKDSVAVSLQFVGMVLAGKDAVKEMQKAAADAAATKGGEKAAEKAAEKPAEKPAEVR